MYFDLLLRWVHILAAMILVGGTFFLCYVVVPGQDGQSSDARQASWLLWRPRWARLVMICSGLLLLSGLINAVRIILDYSFPDAPYHALVAVKLLLALAIFWISAVLAGRSELADRLRQKLSFWLTINVVLSIIIVCLAGYMKMVERLPKPVETAVSTESLLSDAK
jgi:hypothetical protein